MNSSIIATFKSIGNKAKSFLDAIRFPGLGGFSIYDLLELYVLGIIRGALTARAGSISFSFFMALFPFLLFVLNLIPFIPLDNFDAILLEFLELLLPRETHVLFEDIFMDIQAKPRGGLLSSVLLLSIILTANGVSAVFSGFEESYHVKLSRNFFKQYLYAVCVAILLAFLLLMAVAVFVLFEYYILSRVAENIPLNINLFRWVQLGFILLMVYCSSAILYYFGTIEGKKARFFSPGASMTTLLLIITTYLFGIYLDNFAQYNQLYGSIGALLIFLLYIWINANILLLGFELNAVLTHLKSNIKIRDHSDG
ncbi:MAG: YihY/virulence factor BrkB family protein [Flavobacteriaceae bacterium]